MVRTTIGRKRDLARDSLGVMGVNEIHQVLKRHGRREEEPLQGMTSSIAQHGGMGRTFHAFRRYLDSQRLANFDHR